MQRPNLNKPENWRTEPPKVSIGSNNAEGKKAVWYEFSKERSSQSSVCQQRSHFCQQVQFGSPQLLQPVLVWVPKDV